MEKIFVVSLLAIFGVVVCHPMDKYTTKYDDIDVEEILKSDRLLNNYFNCIITGEACTANGQEMRVLIPDALQTECSKCSVKQKATTKRVLNFILDNKPEMFKAFEEKFDPEGIYKKKYQEQFKAQGIKISE